MDIVERLQELLGPQGVIAGDALQERVPLGLRPLAVIRPADTREVSLALAACHAAGQSVVPQGGRTGLVNAADTRATDIALSLERLNRIEEIDAASRVMVVQAGVTLQAVQEAAAAQGLMFPLDLGARGSATIGGNLSTNAGGNRVVRYGMMREQVLGLEAVLADGSVVDAMNRVIKNNTGYDIKQLFIGAEGTLGIVTRLVLRLRSAMTSQDMAFVALDEFSQVQRLLDFADRTLGGNLSAFEVMWQDFYRLVTTPPSAGRPPVPQHYNYYVLLEALGGDAAADRERFTAMLGEALESGLIRDAAVATSQDDCRSMWAIRDDVLQVGRNHPIFTFDVSIPVNTMESYVAEVKDALTRAYPAHTCMVFGHLGDGNLHLVVGVGDGSKAAKQAVERLVYDPLQPRGGSISAEHGIGLQKKAYLGHSRNAGELHVMRLLRQALDPKGILNPGKLFDV